MSMISVTSENFEQELQTDIPVVVKVGASWCSPCKVLTPILENLADKYEGVIKVLDVDAEKSPEITSKYKVTSVPFMIVFKNGKVVETKAGFSNRDAVEKLFEDLAG